MTGKSAPKEAIHSRCKKRKEEETAVPLKKDSVDIPLGGAISLLLFSHFHLACAVRVSISSGPKKKTTNCFPLRDRECVFNLRVPFLKSCTEEDQ